MWKKEVMIVDKKDLIEGKGLRKIGKKLNMLRNGIERNEEERIKRDGEEGIIGMIVRGEIEREKDWKLRIRIMWKGENLKELGEMRKVGNKEIDLNEIDIEMRKIKLEMEDLLKLRIDIEGKLLDEGLMKKDIDERIEIVVKKKMKIIEKEDWSKIGKNVIDGKEVKNFIGKNRSEEMKEEEIKGKEKIERIVIIKLKEDIVKMNGRKVMIGKENRNIEIERKIGKLRVKRRKLKKDLGKREWVSKLVGGRKWKMVGSKIENEIEGGMDGMNLKIWKIWKNMRKIIKRRKVIMDVMESSEMEKEKVISERDRKKIEKMEDGKS